MTSNSNLAGSSNVKRSNDSLASPTDGLSRLANAGHKKNNDNKGLDSGDDEGDDEGDDDECGDVADESSFEYHDREHVADSLRCTGCREVLKAPVLQASCGERWHKLCFKNFKLLEESSSCPVCLEVLDREIWRDVFAERELEKLHIVCLRRALGCQWIGEKRSLKEHLLVCQFQKVLCKNGCHVKVLKEKLEQHLKEECTLRTVQCIFCNCSVQFLEMETHYDCCSKVLLECKYECQPGHKMSREALNEHLKICKRRREKCLIIDCIDEVYHHELRKHLEDHLTSHIIKINESLISTQNAACQWQTSLEESVSVVRQRLVTFETAMTSLLSNVRGTDDQLTELGRFVKIKQQETLQSCHNEVDELKKNFSLKSEAIRHNITTASDRLLLLEEITVEQATKIQTLEKQLQDQVESNKISSIEQKTRVHNQALAQHDATLAEHGLRIDIMDCKNTSGVLLWKIPDVQRRRRDAQSGKTPSIYSQPFYTSPNGYKLCARLYLNGDNMTRGTHLSLFIVLMKGTYDSLLKWPFQQMVTFMLIDQEGRHHVTDRFCPDPESSSFRRPISDLNVPIGCPQFVPLGLLDSGRYIKDNCIFVKVIVDTRHLADTGSM